MSKFLLEKRFSLGFVGEVWKEKKSFISFNAFTANDVKKMLPKLSGLDEKNMEMALKGVDEMVIILQEKFVSGEAVDMNGEIVKLRKEDIGDLPIEVLNKAVSFLSQGQAESK